MRKLSLLNIFRWPDAYQVAYAGVPVSDLVQRMGYKSQGYRNIFAEFVGKRRSTIRWSTAGARRTSTPTSWRRPCSCTRTRMTKNLRERPGGHHFNRIDTKLARESRQEVYAFLARYLK